MARHSLGLFTCVAHYQDQQLEWTWINTSFRRRAEGRQVPFAVRNAHQEHSLALEAWTNKLLTNDWLPKVIYKYVKKNLHREASWRHDVPNEGDSRQPAMQDLHQAAVDRGTFKPAGFWSSSRVQLWYCPGTFGNRQSNACSRTCSRSRAGGGPTPCTIHETHFSCVSLPITWLQILFLAQVLCHLPWNPLCVKPTKWTPGLGPLPFS